eukprot:300042-Amphidinium_carterae.1
MGEWRMPNVNGMASLRSLLQWYYVVFSPWCGVQERSYRVSWYKVPNLTPETKPTQEHLFGQTTSKHEGTSVARTRQCINNSDLNAHANNKPARLLLNYNTQNLKEAKNNP